MHVQYTWHPKVDSSRAFPSCHAQRLMWTRSWYQYMACTLLVSASLLQSYTINDFWHKGACKVKSTVMARTDFVFGGLFTVVCRNHQKYILSSYQRLAHVIELCPPYLMSFYAEKEKNNSFGLNRKKIN